MAEWERSAVMALWIRVPTLLVSLFGPGGMSERSFCIFQRWRRIHVRLPLACQVAYERFAFCTVPQTDLKHYNPESSLGYAWSPGLSTQAALDASPKSD